MPRTSQQTSDLPPEVPEGFVLGIGPDGQQYLVPQFMVPVIDLALRSETSKKDVGTMKATDGSSIIPGRQHDIIGEARIKFLPNPDLSDRERLELHAKVLALQNQLGISYKDAAHWLYIAELKKLQLQDSTHKVLQELNNRLETSLSALHSKSVQDDNVALDH